MTTRGDPDEGGRGRGGMSLEEKRQKNREKNMRWWKRQREKMKAAERVREQADVRVLRAATNTVHHVSLRDRVPNVDSPALGQGPMLKTRTFIDCLQAICQHFDTESDVRCVAWDQYTVSGETVTETGAFFEQGEQIDIRTLLHEWPDDVTQIICGVSDSARLCDLFDLTVPSGLKIPPRRTSTGQFSSVQVYVTAAESAICWHTDNCHTLVFCVCGVKLIRCQPPFASSHDVQTLDVFDNMNGTTQIHAVTAGSWFYIPKGWYHSVWSSHGSVSVSVAVAPEDTGGATSTSVP